MAVLSSLKKVINLHRNYDKLHCKGEPYQFSVLQDLSIQTDRQTDRHTDTDTQTQILLLFHKDKTNTEKENVEFEIT